MKLFGRRKKKSQKLDDAFHRVYEEIQSIDNWDDPQKLEHYILDSCEQIIAATKEIEEEKREYRNITAHLNDIKQIESLPKQRLADLREVAANLVELNSAREAYRNISRNITDEQFVIMEEDEETLPATIRRMQENEKYQSAVKRDMAHLEGEKSRWEIEREGALREQKLLRQFAVLLFAAALTMVILIMAVSTALKSDPARGVLLALLIFGICGFGLYIRINYVSGKMRKALFHMNQSISLLNVVRMKYVNVTNAIEYTKEKYGVNNSYELNYLWEQYLEAVQDKQRVLKNNDDLEYFTGRLIRMLQTMNLFDHKIWLTQTDAIIDPREMVEVKHHLVQRRQKIRERIQENTMAVKSERDEIDRLMREHEHYVPEILEIIKSVDRLCGLTPKK